DFHDDPLIIVNCHRMPLRLVLTHFAPLDSLERVCLKVIVPENPCVEEPIRFRYPKNKWMICTDPSGVRRQEARLIPFEHGELAFRQNWLIFNPDGTNTISMALSFLEKRMEMRAHTNVRWAMLFLGKVKAVEGIPVLLKYIDYQYTTHGLLEESYPAVKALTMIGRSAVKPVLDALGFEHNELRRRLMTQVLVNILGLKETLEVLNARSKQRQEDEKMRLISLLHLRKTGDQVAERALDELTKNHGADWLSVIARGPVTPYDLAVRDCFIEQHRPPWWFEAMRK
ncbi:MAG: hypothetical protein NZM42_01290, partial [Gemmatales bacterium]|nr:hypothetical protein [Gemmatales bacterium]